jgi:hypothetical protein
MDVKTARPRMCQRAKAVVLQFEEPRRIIEGFERSGQLRGYNRREHASIISTEGASRQDSNLRPPRAFRVLYWRDGQFKGGWMVLIATRLMERP